MNRILAVMLSGLLGLAAWGQPRLLPTAVGPETLHGPAAGRLLIIGGGEVPDEIWDTFVRCAEDCARSEGSPDPRITVITNASGEERPYTGPALDALGGRLPQGRVTVLHLRDIQEANDPALIAPLLDAHGVFFVGGRQWRISEVYLNTRAHAAMNAVLERGGVIGGTSAGASIQGSFLWRGDTLGPEITVGDHTQGLGFMKRTVIDQHLFARHRESDLQPFLQAAPAYLGLGVDESTAVLVERDSLTVLGRSKAIVYVPVCEGNGQVETHVLEAGEGCDLRRLLQEADGIRFSVSEPKRIDGYPLANFAITANVSAEGELFGRVLHNRGKLGDWLTDLGGLRLELCKARVAYPLSSFSDRDVRRAFPFVTASLSGHPILRSEVSYKVWAPIGLDDLDAATLPALQLELTLTNPSDAPETLALVWRPDTLGRSPSHRHDWKVLGGEGAGMALRQAICTNQAKTCTEGVGNGPIFTDSPEMCRLGGVAPSSAHPVIVPPGGSTTLRYVLALYDPRDYAALRFDSAEAIADYVFAHWDVLRQATEAFEEKIPRTGYPGLDDILRWYMVPGVALTKCTSKEKIVTLGYCELNQRDSYWASWLHLVLMPAAERTMIEESIGGMRPSGKVPTCILPRIDRKDDIDINAFFLLRFYRYYHYYGDRAFLETHWDALRKAADWLLSRDLEGTGLPKQTSTWADWKDVSGVEGRSYSPYAALVYTAAMRRMAAMAADLDDAESKDKYGDAAARAYERINLPRSKGGLWNGKYYCQLWEDGRMDDRLLQDQTVGILFDVIPRGRARRIVQALNRSNRTPYGICETYPYYPASFGYEPATYHNGGVWPWLSFVDDWGRLKLGRKKEALDLVRTVARADLADSGDWAANEHLNSLTGENLGFQLQGWNAGLFGLVWFGLQHPDSQP